MTMNDIIQIGDWKDDLIWCPSQCRLTLACKNRYFVLYLRWRWQDPWTASLYEIKGISDTDSAMLETWTEIEVPYFKDIELDELKIISLDKANEIIKKLTE